MNISFRVTTFPQLAQAKLEYAVLTAHEVEGTDETVEVVTALCSTEGQACAAVGSWETPARVVQLVRDAQGRPLRWASLP